MRQMHHLNLRRLHRASAWLLVIFACAHTGNHLWALRGVASHIELMDGLRLVYRHPLVEPLLLASVLVQCVSGWWLVAAAASIVASLAGTTVPVVIPADYLSRLGAGDTIFLGLSSAGPKPNLSPDATTNGWPISRTIATSRP